MAYLQDLESNSYFPLAAHHTFGRLATSVNTQINKPYVSKLHAAIEWNGHSWRIKHLGLNNTWINRTPLAQGDTRELTANDLIQIAELQDPGFRVIDLTPPRDMLWPLSTDIHSSPPIELSGYHLLPDNHAPEIAIFFDEIRQEWLLESAHHTSDPCPLDHGDLVQFNNSHWQFMPIQAYGPTEARARAHLHIEDCEFVFNLSLDEETTQLEIHYSDKTIDLGVRTHHYLLQQLARHRAEDQAQGLDCKSQGWVYAEQLASELGLDPTHMNIQIFRARKQLADALPAALGQQCLLERRGGKIRFGCEKFKIYKGDSLTLQAPSQTETAHNRE